MDGSRCPLAGHCKRKIHELFDTLKPGKVPTINHIL